MSGAAARTSMERNEVNNNIGNKERRISGIKNTRPGAKNKSNNNRYRNTMIAS